MRKHLLKTNLLFAITLLLALAGNKTFAQFSQGNLVVMKIGNGVATLSSAAQPVTLVEYTTSGSATGFTVALPSTGNPQLTVSGSATSEGMMALSQERDRILVPGYDAPAATLSVASTTSAAVNREIFSVTQAGTYSKVASTATAYSANNIRGATASSTNYFSAGPSVGNEFLNTSTQLSTAVTNTRVVQIFNGQLYFSSSSGTYLGVSSMGTGIPTTSGQTATLLANSASAYGFSISPDGNTLYLADDGNGINKYTFNGSTYTLAYNVTSTQSRGLVVDYTTTPYTIYATTTETSLNRIIKVQDNGVASAVTTLATASANTLFRGLTWSPVACPSVTPTATNASCYNSNNGGVSLSITGGGTPFTYTWSGPSGYSATTANISNVGTGTYSVTVVAATGCTVTTTANVSQPTAITSTVTPTAAICNGSATGAITAAAAGGTPNYNYTWNGPAAYTATTQNISNIAAGTYSLTVTDANSCTSTQSVTVTQPTAISASISGTNALCYGSTGSATVTATGGTPPYTYSWAPSGGTNAVATGISPGVFYSCTITDANNCTTIKTISINQPAQISVTPSHTNVSCNGSSDGSATVSVSGGTPGYTYSWYPTGGTNTTATNLAAGTYICTITDANSCIANQNITVGEPAQLTATTAVTDATCFGSSTGSATVTPTGGTAPYIYLWTPTGGTNANANNLAAGTYTCTITDTHLCSINKVMTVSQPALMTASISAPASICAGSAETVTFTATPNTVVTYDEDGGSPQTVNVNASGIGTVTVTPAANTTFNLQNIQSIGGTCSLTISGSVSTTLTPVVTPTVSITVSPNDSVIQGTSTTFTATAGGGGNISYQWEKNGVFITGATNNTYIDNALANNDNIICIAYTDAPCVTIDSALSNAISMTVFAPCDTPMGIALSNVTYNSATVNWNAVGGIDGYEYMLDQSPGAPVSGTTTTNNTYNATGLVGNTTYYFHLRTVCVSNFSTSDWVTVSFNTSIIGDCLAPSVVNFSNITANSADVDWPAVTGISGYHYVITTSAADPINAGTNTSSTSCHVSNLINNTAYYFHVRSNCVDNSFSPWATWEMMTVKVGVVSTTTFNVTAYPNPATSLVTVEIVGATGTHAMLTMTDITGKMISCFTVNSNKTEINTSDLPAGTYMLRYNDDVNVRVLKLIKE